MKPPRSLGQRQEPPRALWVAPLSVMAGSLVTLLPVVTSFPILPPFGLLVLLGWRLRRPELLPVWAPAPLGLFDDLVSGQPFGCATLLWTLVFLALQLIDTRLVWRDFWQDWLIAAGGTGAFLILARFVATPFGAHVDTTLLLQLALSILLYPLIARLCARLDPEPAK